MFEVTWTPGTNRIQDRAGNAAAGFRQTVTAGALGKPVLQSAVAGRAPEGHVLTYDKAARSRPSLPADEMRFTLHLDAAHHRRAERRRSTGRRTYPNDPNVMDTTADTLGVDGDPCCEVSGKTVVQHLRDPETPLRHGVRADLQEAFRRHRSMASTELQRRQKRTRSRERGREQRTRAYRCKN